VNRPPLDALGPRTLRRPQARRAEAGDHARGQDRAGRVLRLTLLAPEIVEAIMDGRQPEWAALPVPMKGIPVEWDEQRGWQAS
jgi:hypothetical protein